MAAQTSRRTASTGRRTLCMKRPIKRSPNAIWRCSRRSGRHLPMCRRPKKMDQPKQWHRRYRPAFCRVLSADRKGRPRRIHSHHEHGQERLAVCDRIQATGGYSGCAARERERYRAALRYPEQQEQDCRVPCRLDCGVHCVRIAYQWVRECYGLSSAWRVMLA